MFTFTLHLYRIQFALKITEKQCMILTHKKQQKKVHKTVQVESGEVHLLKNKYNPANFLSYTGSLGD